WNVIEDLDARRTLDSVLVARRYTWGLDLSGQNGSPSVRGLHGAGGIGGLLAVHQEEQDDLDLPSGDYAYTYDANGNVGELLDWSAAGASSAIVAHYEYDPYGSITRQTGDYADVNAFRFSTKFFNPETGLYDYG